LLSNTSQQRENLARFRPHTDLDDAFDIAVTDRALADEVIAGLRRTPKEIASSWFYDETGSTLFDMICDLPEYYPTRVEMAIMRARVSEMAELIGEGAAIVEFGSGTSMKTRLLLDRLDADVYVPIDIAFTHLLDAASAIARDYPWLAIAPLCADFTKPIDLPRRAAENARKVIYFPGSTIGNFEPAAAHDLLSRMRAMIGEGGAVLIGVDLKKDPTILERAYNDVAGITAKFNLNVLRHVNRVLNGNFRLDSFAHDAVWVDSLSRVEMRLVSKRQQRFEVAGETIAIAAGEYIRTECCYKYTLAAFAEIAESAGLGVKRVWLDDDSQFSVQLFEPR
jgi:L-histidine Nalpha-methyltransferase